jgi:hypothetical protein
MKEETILSWRFTAQFTKFLKKSKGDRTHPAGKLSGNYSNKK